jgi:uncharacterized protein RhaS with RHS repeats
VIATKTYTVSYLYNAAGLISQITYPSGRIVIYPRNTNGQVTGVTTKQNATAAVVNVATDYGDSSLNYKRLNLR